MDDVWYLPSDRVEDHVVLYTVPQRAGFYHCTGAAPAYRSLCMRGNKLTRVGILGTPTSRSQRFSAEAQHDIITAHGSLPLLAQLSQYFSPFSILSSENILEQTGSGLTESSVDVNFEDCIRGQFITLTEIINLHASIHNRNLVPSVLIAISAHNCLLVRVGILTSAGYCHSQTEQSAYQDRRPGCHFRFLAQGFSP